MQSSIEEERPNRGPCNDYLLARSVLSHTHLQLGCPNKCQPKAQALQSFVTWRVYTDTFISLRIRLRSGQSRNNIQSQPVMMTSRWVPHGLIQDQDLEEVYQAAKLSVDRDGNCKDPKEYHTIHLFEDLFNLLTFPRPNYKTNSQQPPSDKVGSDKLCDLATKAVDDGHKWHMFCFSEGKRASNTSDSKIKALEVQAQGYCKEFVDAHPHVNRIYANTLVGASIRCWSYTRGDSKLRGFWNGDEKDHFEHYRDVGNEEHKLQLERAFADMKSMPPGVLHRGQDHSQIGASSSRYSTSAAYPLGSSTSAVSSAYGPVSVSTYSSISGAQQVTSMSQGSNSVSWSSGLSGTSQVVAESSTSATSVPLRDEDYVEVTIVKRKKDIADNVYEFHTHAGRVQKLGSDFFESTDPRGIPCMAYYGPSSKTFYWTTSLDPDSGYVRIGGKGKK